MAKFCGQCGTKLTDEAKFCSQCGANQSEEDTVVTATKKPYGVVKMDTVGDYMYENAYREDLEDTVIAAASSLNCTFLRDRLSTKQVKNAISFCNNDFTVADIVLVRDTTDFNSMKEGLIITYYGAYYIWQGKLQSKVKFNQVKSIKKQSSYGVGEMKFVLYDGREIAFKLHSTKPALQKIFVEIGKCIGRHREDYPMEIL